MFDKKARTFLLYEVTLILNNFSDHFLIDLPKSSHCSILYCVTPSTIWFEHLWLVPDRCWGWPARPALSCGHNLWPPLCRASVGVDLCIRKVRRAFQLLRCSSCVLRPSICPQCLDLSIPLSETVQGSGLFQEVYGFRGCFMLVQDCPLQYNPCYNDGFRARVKYRYKEYIVLMKIALYYVIYESNVLWTSDACLIASLPDSKRSNTRK